MSCVSATSALINHAKFVPTLLQRLKRPWQLPFGRLTEFLRCFERRSSRRELLELNDHLLADISLSRHDTGEDALKASRMRLTMLHVHR
ncbi:DUF1127 domain-containing protein [Tardiphaga sp. 804_B3_N1_9]|uniref:DUF1127 domain-containing protein n=1 Tax=Tardiphaga sp. 804_B3_N1_9 TaxID=3240786 RepID=UPI003F212A24